jgi:hypothetical protein
LAQIAKSVATLRVSGDELVPAEITRLLGCPPTSAYAKGDVIRGNSTGRESVKRHGLWRLEAEDREPENLDAQIAEVLARLTQDLAVWEGLARRFQMDFFCGLFMDATNAGMELSSQTMRLLAERGINIGLDVYAPTRDPSDGESCPCGSGRCYGECCKRPTDPPQSQWRYFRFANSPCGPRARHSSTAVNW